MCPRDWAMGAGCQTLGQSLFWARLDEINISVAEESRWSAPVWVGVIQSVEGLNRTKGLTIPQIGGNNSSCLVTFEPGHRISLPLDWIGRHRLSWGSSWLTPPGPRQPP